MKNIFRIDLNQNRIFGLDILRAFAILFVVAGHAGNLVESETYKYVNLFLFDGVGIFFVLSGFLIGGILIKLLKNNKVNLKLLINFWIRRWFRTLPNYFLILTTIVIINLLFSKNFAVIDKLKYFIFSQNLFSEHPAFFPEAWSLSIEEWFYLLTPIIIFTFIKIFKTKIDNSILITAIGIILSITFFRYYRYSILSINDIDVWNLTFRTQVFTRLDSLMYGILGAYAYYKYRSFWAKHRAYFFFSGIFLFVFDKFNFLGFKSFELYDCVFSFSVISLATLFLLPFLSTLKNGKGPIYKSLTYISLISYSMYLVNYTIVLEWVIMKINWLPLQNLNSHLSLITKYCLFWFLTIFLSIIIYKYFETPFMKLRDKITLSKKDD